MGDRERQAPQPSDEERRRRPIHKKQGVSPIAVRSDGSYASTRAHQASKTLKTAFESLTPQRSQRVVIPPKKLWAS